MASGIDVTVDERCATVWFDRPEKRNALDPAMSAEIARALTELEDEPVPLVFRSRHAGMFVAGTDVGSIRARSTADSLSRLNARLFQRIADHPWPTIAVVEGHALGGGCELALACDVRLTAADTLWGLPEVRLGIIPGAGGVSRLRHLIGHSRAVELILTGRRLDGTEAERIGLAQRVAPTEDLDDALGYLLEQLGKATPLALRLAKEALTVDGDRGRLVDAAAQALCIASDDAQERLEALATRMDRS